MELVDALDRTFRAVAPVIRSLEPADLDRPTPCEGWDVRAVLGHLFGVLESFSAVAREGAPPSPPSPAEVADDPGEQFARLAEESVAAWRTPGAAERATSIPGIALIELVLADAALHGWDVAAATGRPLDLPGDVVEHLLAKLEAGWAETGRQYGAFGPAREVPPGASPVQRLAAITGRTPAPTP